MKKNVELLNIEVGTFRRVGKKLSIKLDRNQFRYDSVSELNELKKTTADFLPLVNIAEQEEQIELTYQLPALYFFLLMNYQCGNLLTGFF